MSEKTAVYSQENAASGIPLSRKELQAANERVKDVANDCTRAHHRAILSPRSDADGGAPNCMENVMASDTSPRLCFEGLMASW